MLAELEPKRHSILDSMFYLMATQISILEDGLAFYGLESKMDERHQLVHFPQMLGGYMTCMATFGNPSKTAIRRTILQSILWTVVPI